MADTEIKPGASREDREKVHEDVRAERIERDAEVLARTTPTPVTAKDALGVERIVTTTTGYDAPQTDPDPKEVARLKAVQKRLDNQAKERLKSLTDAPDGSAKVAADALAAQTSVGTTSTSSSTSTTTSAPKGGTS